MRYVYVNTDQSAHHQLRRVRLLPLTRKVPRDPA